MTRAIASLTLLALLSGAGPENRPPTNARATDLPFVLPNDNRSPAGRLSHDTLQLHLVVGVSVWRPEADSGPSIEVAAFGEEGQSPQVPGPLIRVPTGTVIAATIRNQLSDSTLRIYGLVTRPATTRDSLVVPPGESRSVVFAAGAPGSYLYWASLGNSKHERDAEREQIAGAFIVDPPGGSPPDRVLVMNVRGTRVDSATYRNALTINGRSWPYTERIRATVGDTLRWRVPNASWRNHPMHLHGFYYRVEARGDGFADTLYSAAARRQVVTERGARPPAADSIETQGSVLVLTRGQPTDIVVVNRLSEPTAIHWHGIELESYSDGVAGWSGTGDRLAPSVMPGDSFTARLTLPRAGTFMYHTHLNDIEQLISGLYGGIVVLEPGKRFDARRDHLFVTGWDGEIRAPALPHLIINGDSLPGPLLLAAGVVHRLRFVNIAPAGLIRYAIYRDTSLVTWRRLAKDGADLPPAQSIRTPSTMLIAVGETYDFEFTPDPGRYRLVAEIREKPLWTRELVVR